MSESTPIYSSGGGSDVPIITGETSKAAKAIYVIAGIAVGFLTLFTLISTLVIGIQRNAHLLALALSVITFAIVIILYFLWYRNDRDTMSPKWKVLLIILVSSYMLFLITLNIGVWWDTSTPADHCTGLYDTTTQYCYPVCSTPGLCLVIASRMCLNCSVVPREAGPVIVHYEQPADVRPSPLTP